MPATSILARTRTSGVSMSSCSMTMSSTSRRWRKPCAMPATSAASPAPSRARSRSVSPGSVMSRLSCPVCSRSCESSYSPVDASSRYAATAVSISRPVRSIPSGSSERMTSLTPWPTKGRARMLFSFLTTDAAPSCAAGTRTPSPASSPSVATRTSATSSLRPGMPFQPGGQGEPPGAELGQLLGDLGGRGGQRHVAQVEGRNDRFRRWGLPRGGGGDHRLCTLASVGGRAGTAGGGLAESAGIEKLLQAVPDRLHLEAVEGGLRRAAVPAAQRRAGPRPPRGARRARAG